MSTPDSVNLIKQHSLTLDELPKRKTAKILTLQLQQRKAPNRNLQVSTANEKSQDIENETVINLSAFSDCSPLTCLSNDLPSKFSMKGL